MGLIGRIIDKFRGKPPETKPSVPQLVEKKQSFYVVEDKLVPRVDSLDQFYEHLQNQFETERIFQTMRYAEGLTAEDQSELDKDPREKHVEIPNKFTSTPQGYSYSDSDISLEGNDRESRTVSVLDSEWMQGQRAHWNKEEKTFSFRYQEEANPDYTGEKTTGEILAQAEFSLETDNPKEIASRSREGERAAEILRAAEFWQDAAKGLDNSKRDLSESKNSVVLPGVPVQELSGSNLQRENVLTVSYDAGSPKGNPLYFEHFDIEYKEDSFQVIGSKEGGGNYYGSKLIGTKSDECLTLEVVRPETGTREKVEWNTAEGIVAYEKSKKG